MKSDVFVNQSGDFVKKNTQKSRIKPEELLIVHDDADIEIGKYKISFGRNAAGHKGAEDIIKKLKTKNFWRLRIGIRRPTANKDRDKAGAFVLKKIRPADRLILKEVFERVRKEKKL